MGLLDDAIREHLELKRRRGADPDEVARQEDEALGAPRRGEFAPTEPPAAVQAPAAEPAPVEEELPAEPAPVEEELPAEPPAAYPAEPEPEPEPEAVPEEPWLGDDEPVAPPGGQPTAEFTPPGMEPEPEVVRPDDEPPREEDVLEETPDFLQETPDHDRLWFEQRPPKDFDFDK